MPELSQAEIQSLVQQGLALHRQGSLAEAQQIYRRVLAAEPGHFDALNLLGSLALQAQDFAVAEDLIGRALAINPSVGAALMNRGRALLELKRPAEALANYDAALALDQTRADAHRSRGNALMALDRPDEARASYDRALALKSDDADAWNNRGSALLLTGQAEAALASFEGALALDPGQAEFHYNRGNALRDLRRLDEAAASYDRALALKADYAKAHNNRGHVAAALGRLDDALASYERAWALDPDHDFVLGTLLHTRMKLCDWSGLPERLDRLRKDVLAGKDASMPLPLLALADDPSLHRRATTHFVETAFSRKPLVAAPAAVRRDRIRLGYFSGDFCNHPVAHLIVDLLEAHDRAKFEVIAFSSGPHAPDDMQGRIASAVDTFIDVRDKGDADIARIARDLGIDVAIDLTGHTQFARTGIFAERCAPLQVHYLGYLGTMGADFIDYVIADDTVIPPDRYGDYAEKIIALPHSHQVNATTRTIADRIFTRQEAGLPETGFVFCCFNNTYKICPPTFDRWMKILQAVDDSVLWLVGDTAATARNLRKEARARGVDPDRLVFAPRVPRDQYLARQRLADLFLDTLPYNAGTTASDALWAGLPVLTCMGASFASRVAASLLKALNLPGLITTSGEAYEARAIELAKDADQLAAIRRRLVENRVSAPLFDVTLFAKHIEAAYTAIHERRLSGLSLESIRIAANP